MQNIIDIAILAESRDKICGLQPVEKQNCRERKAKAKTTTCTFVNKQNNRGKQCQQKDRIEIPQCAIRRSLVKKKGRFQKFAFGHGLMVQQIDRKSQTLPRQIGNQQRKSAALDLTGPAAQR